MRAVEASKRSAEALHKAHRESEEVLDNLLKTVEDFDNQVHSVTMREDTLVVGAELPPGDGKSHCTDRTMILLALPHRHKGSHIVQAPPETKVEMRPRGSTGRRTPEIGIGAQCATSTGLPQARPLAACSHRLWSRECFLRLAAVELIHHSGLCARFVHGVALPNWLLHSLELLVEVTVEVGHVSAFRFCDALSSTSQTRQSR